MATPFNSQYHFCLFCYKIIDSSLETTERSKVVQTFINQLNGYVKNTKRKTNGLIIPTVVVKKCCVDNLLNCCNGCQDKLETFCEKYQHLKILEMELDWKLGQLMEEINYANILPTRWIHVDKVLEDAFQDGLEMKRGRHFLIKKLREFVFIAGNQKRKQSCPRVHLKRDNKLDEEAIKIEEEAKVKEKALSGSNLKESTTLSDDYIKTECIEDVDSTTNIETEDQIIDDLLIQIKAEHSDTSDNIDDGPQFSENIDQNGNQTNDGSTEFKCPKCAKSYKRRFDLQIHLEAHKNPNEWKYRCTECNKIFSAQRYLKYHMAIHQNRKRLQCTYCPSQFVMGRHLNRHINNKHSNQATRKKINRNLEHREKTDQEGTRKFTKRFGCPVCWRFYPNKSKFQLHMESHQDPSDWKFECETCTRKFSKEANLRLHRRSHTKVQIYQCKFCGKKYKYVNSLRLHTKNIHGEEEEVMADIAVKENKKKAQVKTSNAAKMLEVKENCSLDEVECEEIRISANELEGKDGEERDNVNELTINEMVVEDGNIFGDDGPFVDLDDIY